MEWMIDSSLLASDRGESGGVGEETKKEKREGLIGYNLRCWFRPTQRGFLCDDASIRLPYRDSTIEHITIYIVSMLALILLVPLIFWFFKYFCTKSLGFSWRIHFKQQQWRETMAIWWWTKQKQMEMAKKECAGTAFHLWVFRLWKLESRFFSPWKLKLYHFMMKLF